MPELKDSFTSTGAKFFWHQEAMQKLRNGKGQPIVTHLMPTDVCNHTCAFCSVGQREGDVLPFRDMLDYLDILLRYGLKAVIISGGGNPILYKCKKTGRNFNDLVDAIHERGLEIGLITNGMPLREFAFRRSMDDRTFRDSWGTVRPETLDKLTWIRISMSGLDHEENEVYVPDIDRGKTTLGFSYVAHDIYFDSAEKYHGKVSTPEDLVTIGDARKEQKGPRYFADRVPELVEQFRFYVDIYKPSYLRLLPNCLQPNLIADRVAMCQKIADAVDPSCVFVQYKPPKGPNVCYMHIIHPVLNCDGYVYPCDSVVLAAAELGYQNGRPNHKFDSPWRVCSWKDVSNIYDNPLQSAIKNPREQCRGCVFWAGNEILEGVRSGTIEPVRPLVAPVHPNFI